MNKTEFEQFIHKEIPITEAMKFSVLEYSVDKVRIKADLKANKNDKWTVFGGSIGSLMTICGWGIMLENMERIDSNCQIVIQNSNIQYLLPATDDFYAECIVTDEERAELKSKYYERGKGKLELQIKCYVKDQVVANFVGKFVAIRK